MAKIRMYSTAVCPFCLRAEMLLGSKGVTEIEKIRVDLDPRQREEMMNKTGRRTVPQIYIGDTHVTDHPIRIFHGRSDDWVEIAPCASVT